MPGLRERGYASVRGPAAATDGGSRAGTQAGERYSAEVLDVVGVVTAVDPELLLSSLGCGDDLVEHDLAAAPTDERTIAETFARQLEYANVLALAPCESPDPADCALLTQLHPTAVQVMVGQGGLHAAAVAGFDVTAAAERHHPATV
ncbi:hypothetical protein ACFRFL_38080 [Streptomyces sp. NPDC056708]|uniref:hypothetical protein n=1 Tax=unclassified Streptomyces TaxID=2593676 RepID=UPI0036A879FA